MLIYTIYSNQSTFDKQDNPFINFLLNHPIRLTKVEENPYLVMKDLIEALGYSSSSSQHLCSRCRYKKRVSVETPKGMTRVNIIPLEDALPLILQCRFRKNSIRAMQRWIMDQVYRQARSVCTIMCEALPHAPNTTQSKETLH